MFSFFYRNFFFLLPLVLSVMATGHMQAQENNARSYAASLMDGDLKNAVLSVLALTSEGDTIVSVRPEALMMPASDMKLVTTGLALDRLGPDFVFTTRIGYHGEVSGGILRGDLYIMGGGDPTLGSDDDIAASLPEVFGQWTEFVRDAGISRIEGHVIGDSRYFGTAMPEDQSWQWDDCGTYYGAGICGLSFYENKQDFKVTPGEKPGDPVTIEEDFPECPWMEYLDRSSTGEEGTGDRLYYYTSDLAPAGEMRGTLAAGLPAKILECSNKFPAYTCASYFTGWLERNGIECTGGAADTGHFASGEKLPCQDNIIVIGSTSSPSLAGISRVTNHDSNNVYAETLFHTTGRDVCGTGSHEDARQAAKDLLAAMGIDTDKIRIQDGSGLSRQNLVSTGFLCRFLLGMEESKAFGSFVSSLPSPGDSGTMEGVMAGYDSSLKSRIRLKSGSMTGVKCFSGYIFPPLGSHGEGEECKPAVFSIMINNSILSQYRMQKIMDRFIFLIASGTE